MKTIRRNAFKTIAAILAECPLITEFKYDDMGDTNRRLTAEQALATGKEFEFDRVYHDENAIRLSIHQNWTITGWKSIEAAKHNMTEFAQRKYGI